MSGLQILALISGLGGLGATIGATVSNEWKATSRASSVITATWVLQGLWHNCAGNAIGALHCRPHHTILNLDGYIQACRGLMIAAVCLGFFGTVFALVGMKCTKIGGSDKSKARIACFAARNLFIWKDTRHKLAKHAESVLPFSMFHLCASDNLGIFRPHVCGAEVRAWSGALHWLGRFCPLCSRRRCALLLCGRLQEKGKWLLDD
ncbi:claudin-10-like isoform X6 [Phyllopteryx taeniolatus]|uniref:claudin-10-like isoform X6 n=1 Tax=Phyllopteryx taeniolatus TaxID=161469 RepID=UPI002AD44F8E|nr:claudin-10-like isoform X6 [Phyllopteryx taeniolatus]